MNPEPTVLETAALPIELYPYLFLTLCFCDHTEEKRRRRGGCDIFNIQIEAQRSGFDLEEEEPRSTVERTPALTEPEFLSRAQGATTWWWAFGDSNPGPAGYEPAALTN